MKQRPRSNRHNAGTFGDNMVTCDICGFPYRSSQMSELSVETGRGGLIVCPNDKDKIDYGLVPYVIPTERIPDVVRTNNLQDTTNIYGKYAPITNYQINNPLGPTDPVVSDLTWDEISTAWNLWSTPWGT